MNYDEFFAMNTVVQVAAEGDPRDVQPGFKLIRYFVEASEERFSRFRESSELSRLNRSTGSWFFASPELFDVMNQAVSMYELTDGLFDPSILVALRNIGYDRSMDEIRKSPILPATDFLEVESPPLEEIGLDPEIDAIYLPEGMQIDLGGIAKGWIAAKAADLMMEFTDACAVSAGGDMALIGTPAGETSWAVSLEDPHDPDRVLAILNILPGGLATSTVTRRHWRQGGQERHHIIDPRNGEPATSSWLSVTVYAKSIIHAEVFAKAMLIAGPSDANELASRVDGLQFSAIDSSGNIVGEINQMERIHVPHPTP